MDAKNLSAEEEIRAIADRHGITFERSALDDYCDDITRLSDDDVVMDDVENLLIAIGRADVYDDAELTLLHSRYFSERAAKQAEAA